MSRDWLVIILVIILSHYLFYIIGAAIVNTICGGCLT
jgi:hypothetical protein